MRGLLLVLIFVSSCSENIDRYHWFQGEWISDTESTIRANPKFLEYGTEELQAISSMLGRLTWSVEDGKLKVGQYPGGNDIFDYEIIPVSDEKFRFISEAAGNLTIRKPSNGFCVEFDVLLDTEPTIKFECFAANHT